MVSNIKSIKLVGSVEEVKSAISRTHLHFDSNESKAVPGQHSCDLVMDQLELIDRRMESLAKALNCLGHFDDGDDTPDAA